MSELPPGLQAQWYIDWCNEHRPHMTLGGRTPNEVYFGCKPANRRLGKLRLEQESLDKFTRRTCCTDGCPRVGRG
jgi:hypothetical protein